LVKWQYGNHIKEDEIGGARSTHGNEEICAEICFYNEGIRPVVRPKLRRRNNIKMYLKGVMCKDVGWVRLAEVRDQQRAFVNTVMNLRCTYKSENFWTS